MRIGIIIGRIGGVDGVALETEKWIEVLRRMGHEVFIISGQFQERRIEPVHEELVPEMSFFSPESYWSQKKAFFHPETDPAELIEHINLYSKVIYKRINQWIREKMLDVLISENASSLPSHLEMGLALWNTVKNQSIPCITHDHDFAWERGERYHSPHEKINDYVSEYFPMRLHNIHAVINTHAVNTLKKNYGRDAVNVPNVMDFDKPFGTITEKNAQMYKTLGYSENDIFLFQITRIVKRKGIETAIELIHRLEDPKIKLIITGNYDDDTGNKYYNELVDQIHTLKISDRVRFAYHCFHNKGLTGRQNGEVNYSLSDAYAQARACTYFSKYEGFGNAFVEAVLARKPVFVNNYEPVYWPDIGSKGFKTVMLENNVLTGPAIEEMKKIIYDDGLNREIAEYNFSLGRKFFSFDVLEQKLEELLKKATGK